MKALVHGVDLHTWMEDGQHKWARRGDIIDVSAEEFKRANGYLIDPDSVPVEATEADEADAAPPPATKTDDQLGAMSGPEILGYVADHPGELVRVLELERAGKQRKTVLEPLEQRLEADTAPPPA